MDAPVESEHADRWSARWRAALRWTSPKGHFRLKLLQQWRRKAAGAGDHQSRVSRKEVEVQNTICVCKIAGGAGSIHVNMKPVPVRGTINPVQPK